MSKIGREGGEENGEGVRERGEDKGEREGGEDKGG